MVSNEVAPRELGQRVHVIKVVIEAETGAIEHHNAMIGTFEGET